MTEWKEVLLQDVVSVLGDGLHGTPKYDDKGDFYFINGNNLSNGRIEIKTDTRRTSFAEYNKYKKPLNSRTILLSINGTVGNIALFNGENCVLGKSACYFNILDTVDKQFIKYIALSSNFQNYIDIFAHGTTIKNVSLKTIREYPFLLPPYSEQQVIASVLSSLDDKIDLLNRQNKTLEEMARTLFRRWFVEESDVGWKTVHIGDYTKTNELSLDKDFKFNTMRYLDTGSLTEGKIEGYQTFDLSDAPSRARRIVKHNDILISTVRPNQKHYGILKHPDEDIIVSTGFCVITCKKINPYFIYILLTTNEMTDFLHSIAEGSTSTYPSLKPSDIENLEFQLPPEDKMYFFSEYADNAWKKIDYNHKQINTLSILRDTLLPKLMTGEVRVSL